jgi:hypothetical protein
MTSLEVRGRGAVRASDGDRDKAARTLRHHYAEGRIDAEELEERVALATRARTTAELRSVLRDLPRPRPRGRGPLTRAAVRAHAASFVAVNGGLAGVWELTGEGAYWPGGVLAPWSVLLAGHLMMRRAAKNAQSRRRPKTR